MSSFAPSKETSIDVDREDKKKHKDQQSCVDPAKGQQKAVKRRASKMVSLLNSHDDEGVLRRPTSLDLDRQFAKMCKTQQIYIGNAEVVNTT